MDLYQGFVQLIGMTCVGGVICVVIFVLVAAWVGTLWPAGHD